MGSTWGADRAVVLGQCGLRLAIGRLAGILLGCIAACSTQAEVELLSERPVPAVFGAGTRPISFRLRNAATQTAEVNLRYRLFQASSATLMPLGEVKPWKLVTVPAAQTLLETFQVELPAVRGDTLFQIAWFDGERKIGTTPVRVFGEGILKMLGPLAGDQPVGLVDPEGQMKLALAPLRSLELKEAEDIVSAEAALILVAPMTVKSRPAGLSAALKKKAALGAGIVWLQPTGERDLLDGVPTVFVAEEASGRIVVASELVAAELLTSPRAQQSLVRLAEIAAGRRKLELPTDPSP